MRRDPCPIPQDVVPPQTYKTRPLTYRHVLGYNGLDLNLSGPRYPSLASTNTLDGLPDGRTANPYRSDPCSAQMYHEALLRVAVRHPRRTTPPPRRSPRLGSGMPMQPIHHFLKPWHMHGRCWAIIKPLDGINALLLCHLLGCLDQRVP